jgi:SAM-dependent methyltransferase
MTETKAWDWEASQSGVWLEPAEESYFLAHRWKAQGRSSILDLGCGLGRHSVFFAKCGFSVSGMDLSPEGVRHLEEWAKRENLRVDTKTADMTRLPYADHSFDCVFAYHVISHCDTAGIRAVIGEIGRVLKPGGELYCTVCSKDSWSFREAGFPKADENTVIKTCDGPEKGIPHFYADLDGILNLFCNFHIFQIRHVDDCWFGGEKHHSAHYFILVGKNSTQTLSDN